MKQQADIPHRSSGVLLHVSSLASPYGIGGFGSAAKEWVRFLSAAGQSYWQVLPLGPTSFGDSPYQSFSAFAGNPFFIDLDRLVDEGLLLRHEIRFDERGENEARVDYAKIYRHRREVLRSAYRRFASLPVSAELDAFVSENGWWLEDYALYMAVKERSGNVSWLEWPEELRMREPAALDKTRGELADEIRYHGFVQMQFFRQWNSLRSYANSKGIRIIGDIPIYVAMDSADVWANRGMFQLREDGSPTEVSGCPPDAFSSDGQLWGNPLYRWGEMEEDGFSWWKKRIAASFALYDVLRIDHFRGLESYYAIEGAATTAKDGRWRKGPGIAFVDAIKEAVPHARIIAEDLGYLTDEVRALMRAAGYPGMKVLQFAFDSREPGDYSPYTYGENNIVFPGTHDNDTVLGWSESAPPKDIAYAMEYMGVREKSELPLAMIRLAMQSRAVLSVIPLQDWLELPGEARMNTPSTVGGNNWRWRMKPGAASEELAERIKAMTTLYGRINRTHSSPTTGNA